MLGRRSRHSSREKSEQHIHGTRMGRAVSVRRRVIGNSAEKSTTLTPRQEIRYQIWKRKLIHDPEIMGGETVFPNSRITVRRIAALVERGERPQVILEDYPNLRDIDLKFAPLYIKDMINRVLYVEQDRSFHFESMPQDP
jgi:uncharacterized protein (DUF433 family)